MRRFTIGCLLILLAVAAPAVAAPAPPASLHGSVVAADGSPAAGALVWAAKLDFDAVERRETVADAHCHYTLDPAPGTWFAWSRRGSQGGEGPRRHQSLTITAGGASQSVPIRLDERGTFHGQLREAETGKPIPGGQPSDPASAAGHNQDG
jgi:hypothetical protein